MGIQDDNIVHNILIRLPTKPLLRFRCVSKHWNCLITDPYCMKSRSRRMIILPASQYYLSIINQENEKEKDQEEEEEGHTSQYSTLKRRSPLRFPGASEYPTTLGTCNGIVLLVLASSSWVNSMILYNPLTRASKGLELPPCRYLFHYIYGFGYGETPDELKIVRVGFSKKDGNTCDVFDLKTNSWGTPQVIIPKYDYFPNNGVGKFLNGFLYWFAFSNKYEILALNVKEMVFSKIDLPFHHDDPQRPFCVLLGTLNGCLCMMTNNEKDNCNNGFDLNHLIKNCNGYDLWVMKAEQGIKNVSWMKACSFTFSLGLGNTNTCYYKIIRPISILDEGKIMIREDAPSSSCKQLYIYDTLKKSSQKLNSSVTALNIDNLPFVPVIEYVESLVSP